MSSIWKQTLKRFVQDFKRFDKDERVAKISRAVVEMANNFNLGVNEDHIKELLDMVPEELSNEELLELEQEHIAEEKAREITLKGLTEAFADLNKLL